MRYRRDVSWQAKTETGEPDMSMPRAICCLVLLLAVGRGALFAQAQTSDQGRSLGDVARELRSKKAATPATETETSSQPSISAKLPGAIVTDSPDVERFTEDIRTRVLRNDFAGLDKIADAVRASKTRFPGGGMETDSVLRGPQQQARWKLYHRR